MYADMQKLITYSPKLSINTLLYLCNPKEKKNIAGTPTAPGILSSEAFQELSIGSSQVSQEFIDKIQI
jgi:hypothetical protein